MKIKGTFLTLMLAGACSNQPAADAPTVKADAAKAAQANANGEAVGEATAAAKAEPLKDASSPNLVIDTRVDMVNGKLTFELTAGVEAPWVIKSDAPFSVTLTTSEGVTVSKTKLGKDDFVDKKADAKTVRAVVTKAPPGEHTVSADLDLFACSADLCQRQNTRVETRFTSPRS